MGKFQDHIYFYIDESYKDGFLGVAVVALVGETNIKITKNIISSISKDLIFKHRNKGSGKIHYADNNLSPRVNVVDQIYQMPISVYLSYKKQDISSLTKKQMDDIAYSELLPGLIRVIATKYKKNYKEAPVGINLQFEQLSNKKEKDRLFFTNCLSKLDFNFKVAVVGKDNIFTTLPDYFLGLLGALVVEPAIAWPKVELGLVDSKIGLIIDATNKKREYYERGEEIRQFIKNKDYHSN